MRRALSFLSLLLLCLTLVGCDHASKHLATTHLRGQPPVPLINGVAELRYTENRDIAFSLLRHIPEPTRKPLIFLGACAGLAAILLLWRRSRDARPLEHAAFAMILAGALGNLGDRALHGHVVDFIHVNHWPVFNAADVWLVAGIGLLLLVGWRRGESPPPAHARA